MKNLIVFCCALIFISGKAQTTICPSLDIYEILYDIEVQNALDSAWMDSQEGTANEHEEGGWIVHVYEQTESNPCKNYRTEIIRWQSGNLSAISSGNKPTIENGRVVADFHTHPGPINTDTSNDQFENQVPSLNDLSMSKTNKIPGIIRYGAGLNTNNTHDIIYDGASMKNYHSQILNGVNTHIAGFYDSRIASDNDLRGANYEASDPEWKCRDKSALPPATEDYKTAYNKKQKITSNPSNHKTDPLQFDFKLDLELTTQEISNLKFEAYLNSSDGSFIIIKDDLAKIRDDLRSLFGDQGDFEMHYIVKDIIQGEISKFVMYGETKNEAFPLSTNPLIGISTVSKIQDFQNCFLNSLEETEDTYVFKGKPYKWYKTQIDITPPIAIRLAMKPTKLVSEASVFQTFVGIMKDNQTKQNFLVTAYETSNISIKLLDIQYLNKHKSVDLTEYTIVYSQ